jgi:hypothetical protein
MVLTTHPHLALREGKEYFHSPSGPFWPILLCMLPLPYLCCVAGDDKTITLGKWTHLYLKFLTGSFWNNVLIKYYITP